GMERGRWHGSPLRIQKDGLGYSISPAKMLASTPSLSSHPGILRHGPGTSSGTRSTDGLPVGGPAVCDEEVDVLPIRIRDVQVGCVAGVVYTPDNGRLAVGRPGRVFVVRHAADEHARLVGRNRVDKNVAFSLEEKLLSIGRPARCGVPNGIGCVGDGPH